MSVKAVHRGIVVLLLVGTLVPINVLVDPSASAAATTTAVPTQWIAKQYTELFGRAPTPAEWSNTVQSYADGCNAAQLGNTTRQLATSDEFLASYPVSTSFDRAVRVTALVRAALGHDPNTYDMSAFFTPYDTPGSSYYDDWSAIVDKVLTSGVFIAWNAPEICSTEEADYGWEPSEPLDLREYLGTSSRSRAAIQQAIDDAAAAGGGVVELLPGEVIRVGGDANGNQGLVVRSGVSLTTQGGPGLDAYARMGRIVANGLTCHGYACNRNGIVLLEVGASIHNVWVDGGGQDVERNYKQANVMSFGSTTDLSTHITDNRLSEPGRDGAGIFARGRSTASPWFPIECTDMTVLNNLVTGYGSRSGWDSLGRAQWVDGIDVACEDATVSGNEIVDVTDAGIALLGSMRRSAGGGSNAVQRSSVRDNTVLSAGSDVHAAFAADPVGDCLTVDHHYPGPCLDIGGERDFSGAQIDANLWWTGPRTRADVGLMIGGDPLWGNHRSPGRGISVTDNVTGDVVDPRIHTRANIGLSLLGMVDAHVQGNDVSVDTAAGRTSALVPECPQVQVGMGAAEHASVSPAEGEPDHQAPSATGPSFDDAFGCLVGEGVPLEPLAIAPGGGGFVGSESGIPFSPWGMKIAGEIGTDERMIEDWWDDPAAVAEDLRELRLMGANTVRVLLQFRTIIGPPTPEAPHGTPDPASLDRLRTVVDVAEELGMYVEISGLRIHHDWALDDWYTNADEQTRWAAQGQFWAAVASELNGHDNVAWYDLMNEPVAPATSKSAWCTDPSLPPEEACFTQFVTREPGGRSPEQVATEWTMAMQLALNEAGNTHLTSVGTLTVSPCVAFCQVGSEPDPPPPWHSISACHGGFSAGAIAAHVDFMSTHVYPDVKKLGPDGNPMTVNDWATSTKGCDTVDQPLVVDEVGNLFAGAPHIEQYILASAPEVTGFMGHYVGLTPNQLDEASQAYQPCTIQTCPPEFWHLSLPLAMYRHWVKMGVFTQPNGPGVMPY